MRRSFSLKAPYLRGSLSTDYTGLYYMEYGPEMSRSFRALKVWMSLRHFGVEGYRKLLSQNVKCVEYLDRLVRDSDDFEALHKPNLLMYCFQYAPPLMVDKYGGNPEVLQEHLDTLNQQMVDQIQLSGLAFIMTSRLRNRVVIRMSVCSHRTTLEDIDVVFSKLRETGKSLVQKH